jgi:hypothetical protein
MKKRRKKGGGCKGRGGRWGKRVGGASFCASKRKQLRNIPFLLPNL